MKIYLSPVFLNWKMIRLNLLIFPLALLPMTVTGVAQSLLNLELKIPGKYNEPVNLVAFSPDGKILATAGHDKDLASLPITNSVKLWNTSSGGFIRAIDEKAGQVKAMAFSPDGRTLFTACTDNRNAYGGKLKHWDVNSGRLIRAFEEDIPLSNGGAFSPDGKYLATAGLLDGYSLWDTERAEKIRPLQAHGLQGSIGISQFITFSPDGKQLAALVLGPSSKVVIWETSTGKVIRSLDDQDFLAGGSVSFSYNGKFLASVSAMNSAAMRQGSFKLPIKLWDLSSGQNIRKFEGHDGQISSLAFSPDGKILVSSGMDKTIKFWDTNSGQLIQSTDGHRSSTTTLQYSIDGKLLVSAGGLSVNSLRQNQTDEESLKLLDPVSGKIIRSFEGAPGGSGAVGTVRVIAISPDGKQIAVVESDKTIRLWELGAGRLIRSFDGHTETINSIVFTQDGKYLASGSEDKTLKLWELKTGRLVRTFEGQGNPVGAIAVSPDGRFLASGGDIRNALKSGRQQVDYGTMSPDINALMKTAGIQGDLPTPRISARRPSKNPEANDSGNTLPAQTRAGNATANLLDGKMVRLWDINTGQLIRSFDDQRLSVNFVAFSPDGKLLASTSYSPVNTMLAYNKLNLWEVASGNLIHSFQANAPIAFDADWKKVAFVGPDYRLQLWNTEKKEFIRQFKGQTGGITAAAFSPDGKRLATGITDKTLRLWNVETGEFLLSFEKSAGVVSTLAFSPDGTTLITGGFDPGVKLWSTKTGSLKGTIINLGNGEWIAYTSDNYYNSSPGVGKYISWRVGEQVFPESQFKARFNKPELVISGFQGEKPDVTLPDDPAVKITPGKFYALIIGINNYEWLVDLSTPVDDAKKVAEVLSSKYGFSARLLLDANASRDRILTVIDEYRNILAENDSLLIYYAGHGKYDNSEAKKGYWQPVDAQKTNPATWISADDLTASINRFPRVHHIMIISDSCYSGMIQDNTPQMGDRTEYFDKMKQTMSRTLMSSGGNEPVADQVKGISVFASAFVRGLNQMDHSAFTGKELFLKYIRNSMEGKLEQTPQYNPLPSMAHKGGDFVFIRKN